MQRTVCLLEWQVGGRQVTVLCRYHRRLLPGRVWLMNRSNLYFYKVHY